MRGFVLLMLLLAGPLAAEQPLTNGDIVKLVKAGLSTETILAKILSSANEFDTGTDALVALAAEGVPDEVIRTMVNARTPRQAAATASTSPQQPATSSARRYDVAIHRGNSGKCDGELKLDKIGVKATRCRDIDFALEWKAVKNVCYEYGFRGVIEFRTSVATHRVSTTTPAEAKRIVETIRALSPSVSRVEGCRGK